MQNNDTNIQPDYVYVKFGKNDIIPSKTLSYKTHTITGKVVLTKPKTHQFENDLRRGISKDLQERGEFPTKKEVFISITHNLHAKRVYNSCDLDNRAKTILDALKGVIYDDDNQVKMLWTQKYFSKEDQISSYRISVKILTPAAEKAIGNLVRVLV